MVDTAITAIGGFYQPHDIKVFPKKTTVSWTSAGWSKWTQEGGEEEEERKKSGFMTAEVTYSWLTKFCD